MIEKISAPFGPWIFLKCVLLLFILFAFQLPVNLVDAIAHNGCTKYVPLSGIESLVTLAWQIWALSLGVHLIVLPLFMSDFLRRPRALMSTPALITGVCFILWKITALAGDLKHASRCGEARDFVYPEKLSWIGMDALFWLVLATWFALVIAALRATAYASLRREL